MCIRDSPYVNKMAAEGVIPHIVLEKEFDRVLMEETGKDPDHYDPAGRIIMVGIFTCLFHKHTVKFLLQNLSLIHISGFRCMALAQHR